MSGLNESTDLHWLVEHGVVIEFPGGYWIGGVHGHAGVVRVGMYGGVRCEWSLRDENGLAMAVVDLRGLAAEHGACIPGLSRKTVLAELMEDHADVHFPRGTWLRSDPDRKRLDFGTDADGQMGFRDMTDPGALAEVIAELALITSEMPSCESGPAVFAPSR